MSSTNTTKKRKSRGDDDMDAKLSAEDMLATIEELKEKVRLLEDQHKKDAKTIEELKSKQGSPMDDDDDISDTEIEELDSSDPWNNKFVQVG
ncbi:MAG: hypothetical protein SGARI_004815 [Bacillariaceae sp.]